MVSAETVFEPVAQPTQKSRTLRYESLTIWRGVACLLIVVYHSVTTPPDDFKIVTGVLHQFWIGVPIFFVISGYCIAASADVLRREPVPVRRFFWRRFRRIFPPYWVWFGLLALTVYLVERFVAPGYFQSLNIPPLQEMTKWRLLGNLSLTEAWRCHLTRQPPTVLFWVAAWTLCYEEQFYFVVGLILLIARRFLFGAAALITLVVIAGSIFVSGYDQKTNGTFINCFWLAFAAGVLAYYAVNYVKPERRDWYCIPLIVAVTCVVADPWQVACLDGKWVMALCAIAAFYTWKYCVPRWRFLFSIPLALGLCYAIASRFYALRRITPDTNEQCVAAFLFAFLIIVLNKWDDSMYRSKALAPLRFCGEMCYSLYLVHWPIVAMIGRAFVSRGLTSSAAVLFITVPCCVAVALPVAWVFHRLVERRFWNARI